MEKSTNPDVQSTSTPSLSPSASPSNTVVGTPEVPGKARDIGAGDTDEAANAVPNKDHKKVDKRKLIIVLSLCLCVFLAALDQTIITTAIPVIAGEFESPTAYTWIGSAYLLASAAFMPSWGKFSDIWGRKKVLLCAAILFMIGSVLCAGAQNIGMMLAGRVIQGLGAGGQMGLVNVTISDIVTVRERGLYLSFVGMTWAVASAIGPVLGGVFTGMADWGWRFCFIINVPVGFCAIIGLQLFLNLESPKVTLVAGLKRVDWLGTLLIVAGTVLFLLGFEFGGIQHPWNSAIVVCFIVFGVLLLSCFFIVEWKFAALPLMPLRLFKNRTTVCCYIITFFHGFAFIGGCYFLPLFFQSARGYSPLLSGVFILPFVIPLSMSSGGAGIIIAKTGRYQELIWGGLFLMTVGFGLFIDLNRSSNWGKLVVYQFIAGIGAGPLFQSPLIAVHSTLEPKDIATGTSTFAFVRTLGTALGISLGLVVFQNGMQSQLGELASRHLDPVVVSALTGESASASIEFVKTLGEPVRKIAQDTYAAGMKEMWYFFLATCVCGLVASVGVKKHHLSTELNSSQPMKTKKKPKKDEEEAEEAAEAVAMEEIDEKENDQIESDEKEDPEKDAGNLV